MDNIALMIEQIQVRNRLSHREMARLLGTSLISLHRWLQGTAQPSPTISARIKAYYGAAQSAAKSDTIFESYGLGKPLPLFDVLLPPITLAPTPLPPVLERISNNRFIGSNQKAALDALLNQYRQPTTTAISAPASGMSAGKNTYTYDAHTYHTKVPPQGIAELLLHYLPDGGLVLDPFAGSGMTGVAARTVGYGCILNELSPAAAFIANQFNSTIDPDYYDAGVKAILTETQQVRSQLYQTTCRECGQTTELQYMVWSYQVICPHCTTEFQLWDHCRSYGTRVKEHKILKSFACPSCQNLLKKSLLKRTDAYPVMVGYKCCGSRQQEVTHPLNQTDLDLIAALEQATPIVSGFVPQQRLYEGVNLRQPLKHGLDRIDKFYTHRNLVAMSNLWAAIHRIEDDQLAAFLAFTFTSLYQRVTKLSEFRFWGGSGNTARFNVPYIFNEANVFLTFARKARSISDHLRTTARSYKGNTVVINGSATALVDIPDQSIDLIFTDPPFGANINYSEMNILWEAWLGRYTNAKDEAIVNRFQNKDISAYQALMGESMKECFRVLKPNGWMLLMFMNTSKEVWEALRQAISQAGFLIAKIDLFDKQHGTFKQFVNENAAGFDLVIHCRKQVIVPHDDTLIIPENVQQSIIELVRSKGDNIPYITYLHVQREQEIDYRQMYSEWLTIAMANNLATVDFSFFRKVVDAFIQPNGSHHK